MLLVCVVFWLPSPALTIAYNMLPYHHADILWLVLGCFLFYVWMETQETLTFMQTCPCFILSTIVLESGSFRPWKAQTTKYLYIRKRNLYGVNCDKFKCNNVGKVGHRHGHEAFYKITPNFTVTTILLPSWSTKQ